MQEFLDRWAGHCTVSTSDKVWAAGVAELSDGQAATVWCWGPRDKTLLAKVVVFRDLSSAVNDYQTRVREKQNQSETYQAFDVSRSGLAAKLISLHSQARKELTRPDCRYEEPIDQEGQTVDRVPAIKSPDRTSIESKIPTTVPPRPQPAPPIPSKAIHQVDQCVRHQTYGQGRVVAVSQSGPDEVVTVEFSIFGAKKLVARLAKLQVIE